MSTVAAELARKMRWEATQLAEVSSRLLSEWRRYLETQDDAYVDAVALNLQAYYTGVEKLISSVVRAAGQPLPEGPSWRAELLSMASRDALCLPGPVIPSEQAQALDELRAFRHVVRSVYSFNINPLKVAALVEANPALTATLVARMNRLADELAGTGE